MSRVGQPAPTGWEAGLMQGPRGVWGVGRWPISCQGRVYRNAAMSRDLSAETPTSGIAVLGSTSRGDSIHRARFAGELASTPAMYERAPMPSSGGPTVPWAPGTPPTLWQAPQP